MPIFLLIIVSCSVSEQEDTLSVKHFNRQRLGSARCGGS